MGIKYEDFTAEQWIEGNENIKTEQEMGKRVFVAWITHNRESRFGEVAEYYRKKHGGRAANPDIIQLRQQMGEASKAANSDVVYTVVYSKSEDRMVVKARTPNKASTEAVLGDDVVVTDGKPDYDYHSTRIVHAMKIITREMKAGRVATITEWQTALDKVSIS
jgi:hypothetical protein